MKLPLLIATITLVILCGCATGPRSVGTGPTMAPEARPSLGSPTVPSFTAPATPVTPSYKPSTGGPTLGMPEAYRDDLPPRTSSNVQAPSPKSRTNNYRPTLSLDATANDRPALFSEPVWNRHYRSTDRRPIETLTLGKGTFRVAVLGSLHGDEVQSVALVDELAHSLQTHPEQLANSTVLLIKSPNPDGFVRRTPHNINGIDLNRNFPSANWQSLSSGRAGSQAASEAETRVVIRLLEDFRPALLVHVKDSRGTATVNYEGPESSRADQVATRNGSQVAHDLGKATSGSVENFADTRLQCPSLTLLIPREPSTSAAWTKHRDALVAAVSPTTGKRLVDPKRPLTNTDPFESRPTVRPTSNTIPKTTAPANRPKSAEFPAPVPAHGYLELPSP